MGLYRALEKGVQMRDLDSWSTASCLDCGKSLRPQRAKAADWPGTVKGQSFTQCQACAQNERAVRDVRENDYSTGRHSVMLEKAISECVARGLLDDGDEAMLSAARAAAYGLDYAEAHPKASYAISHLLGPYRECLTELRMTPASRAADESDALAEILGGLGEPS